MNTELGKLTYKLRSTIEVAKAQKTVDSLVEEKVSKITDEITKKVTEEFRKSQPVFEYETDVASDVTNISLEKAISIPTDNEVIQKAQEANDVLVILSKSLNRDPRSFKLYKDVFVDNEELKKAVTTSTGAGFVPTETLSADFVKRVEAELMLSKLHLQRRFTEGQYKIPIAGTVATGYYIPESAQNEATKIPASDPTASSSATLSPKMIAGRIKQSVIFEETSMIDTAKWLRDELVTACAEAIENAIVNGDPNQSLGDYDLTSPFDARMAWNGYRVLKNSNANLDWTSYANSDNGYLDAFKDMMKQMISPVTGVSYFNKNAMIVVSQVGLVELTFLSQFLTYDKLGPKATLLTGQVGSIFDVPVILSPLVPNNLDANGVKQSNGSKTAILVVYRPAFVYAMKWEAKLETEKDIETQQRVYVVTTLADFGVRFTTSSEPVVGQIYNV